ncbi:MULTISPECIES: Flp pilus assembly protein CpaB [Vogesella]|uniref:Flp pilus assembly protein CpaB n=1 Tax=Vogesella indigofera TaxID=45465 RepID=A0ABT5I2E2_VOGIN|nr:MULTISPECIES: Flp pilus assembly protein CpaB [Vogesella]MCQ4145148.1 Flp pilus assembly protein CpaB [Vogesella sp. AC12]MDC7690193.1 Flp pilus assembly protein CpaB [Vogesella indigofera]
MIVVSVIVGLVAVVMASQWINKQTNVSAQKVVIAAVDVDLGSKLTPEMLRLVDWPSGSIPEGAIIDPQTLDGRVLKTSVLRGEAILESKLAPLGTKGGLSAVVMEGKRAMTVRVNDVIGVAGFALPGNYVDILVNTTEDAKANVKEKVDMSISKIVLEHILVLAVAQEASRDDTKPKVVNAVTLEVTPEQAEKLDLARSVGTLSLVLRNQVDPKPVETSGITKQILLRGDEPAPVAKPVAASKPVAKRVVKKVIVKRPAQPAPIAATQNCVEIVSGTSRHIECF